MNKRVFGPLVLVLMLAVAAWGIAAQVREPAKPEVTPVAEVERLRKVEDVKQVCMVNNQFMGKDQIPVEVEGRTYYGCCEMCKERLAKDQSVRYSTDPVSGARVDKATAVIGVQPNGSVLYFENEANLQEYASKQQR
jgi:YHS domain-containing protein